VVICLLEINLFVVRFLDTVIIAGMDHITMRHEILSFNYNDNQRDKNKRQNIQLKQLRLFGIQKKSYF